MKLPINDSKFIFLLSAITIVVALEILSIIGIHIPMPYAPFVFAAFILGIGYNVLWNGVKAIFKLQFSSINLLMTIAVIGAFYLGEYPEAAVVIVLYVLGERLEDIGIENSKSALDELVSKAPKTPAAPESRQLFYTPHIAPTPRSLRAPRPDRSPRDRPSHGSTLS